MVWMPTEAANMTVRLLPITCEKLQQLRRGPWLLKANIMSTLGERWLQQIPSHDSIHRALNSRTRTAETSWSSSKNSAKFCPWGGIAPCHGTAWQPTGQVATLQKETQEWLITISCKELYLYFHFTCHPPISKLFCFLHSPVAHD